MCKHKTMLCLVTGIVLVALVLGACAKATPTVAPTKAPTVAPTKAAPTEVPTEEAACPASTVADPKGVPPGKWPQQYELAEYEELTGCKLTFSENPRIAELNAELNPDSELPPVEERLPEEPLVVQPYEEIGKYGGQLRGVSFAPESGTSGILSWRHVNLVRWSDDLKTIVPDVAKSWEWNKDFTEITFHLRKGHKWSDGEPFTVDDILFWYEDIQLNKDLFPEVRSIWVYGGEPMKIEKIDDVTFKIHFAEPAPGFLTLMATTYIQPFQPKHFLKQFHIKYNPKANDLAKEQGYEDWLGLFRSYYHDWKDSYHRLGVPTLESHVLVEETTEHRRFVANPYYFKVDTAGQQLPYIDEHYETFIAEKEVHILKFIAGEIDLKMQGLDLASYPVYKENEDEGGYTVQMAPAGLGGGIFFCFNITHPDPVKRAIFSDIRFKKAMSLAIDREEINKTIYLGLAKPMQALPADPLSCPFVEPEMETYLIEYDPEKANALLDEMGLTERDANGFRLRPDGKTLAINYIYCQQSAPPLIHQLIKRYWEAVGVKVDLKEVTSEVYRANTLRNEHDLQVWHNDGTSAVMLIADPQRLYPPFATGLSHFTGGPWYDWWKSNGAEGEEPPEDMKRLRDLALQFHSVEPFSDEWMELGKQIVQIHLDHLITIGTVGDVPMPVIISNRLGNVPKYTCAVWDYYWHWPFRVCQFYFKE